MTHAKSALAALSIAGLFLAPTPALANTSAQAKTHTLTIKVDGIEAPTGRMMIAIFQGAENYRVKDALQGIRPTVSDNTLEAEFSDLPEGDYAITLFQDVNGDGKLNLGKFGIPVEPYGFSNDAAPKFGPPQWDDIRFSVSEDAQTQTIKLR